MKKEVCGYLQKLPKRTKIICVNDKTQDTQSFMATHECKFGHWYLTNLKVDCDKCPFFETKEELDYSFLMKREIEYDYK